MVAHPADKMIFKWLTVLLLQTIHLASAHLPSKTPLLPRQLLIQELDPSALTPEEALLFNFTNPALPPKSRKCKVFPGDPEWPSDHQWQLLNKTTNGALVKTIPIGAPCFQGPLYDVDKCRYVVSQWGNSSLQ
ncbi:MAG: hypothetical protein CL912_16570 [Deltaproteobacteria bacterium]|nr:hypothetical protein [Deltaproteobacteria bacterium]